MRYDFRYYKSGRLISLIILLAVVTVPTFAKLSRFLESSVSIVTPSVVALVPASVLVGFTLWVIEIHLWNNPWVNYFLIEIPDVGGRYIGESVSKNSGPNSRDVISDVVVEISQTASKINIKIFHRPKEVDREYVSQTLVAEIIDENGSYHIQAIYKIRQGPHIDNKIDLAGVLGSCRLDYIEPTKEFKIDYFNEKRNTGYMDVDFQTKKLKQKF